MISVSKSKLKARMLEYFRIIEKSGEEIIVTDRNNPVLRITPIKKKLSLLDVFGDHRGKVVYHEDVLSDTSDEWDDLK